MEVFLKLRLTLTCLPDKGLGVLDSQPFLFFQLSRSMINFSITRLTSFLPVILLLTTACSTTLTKEKDTKRPPNILIIMADDMGYSDIGSYGSEISTPNLDLLAKNGLRFRNFYNAARCCPTRASLLTGLYPHEAGMGGMVSSVKSTPATGPYQGYLNENCVTMAEVLGQAGYQTYMSGKWHVGEKPEHWPRKRGFQKYFGLISGASSYYEIIREQSAVRQMVLDDQLWDPPKEGFYMTDAITDQAVEYLKEHHSSTPSKPFFMYMAYTAPHWPLHALPEDVRKYEGVYSKGWDELRQSRFARMKELGILDKTYVLSSRDADVPAWEEVDNKAEWERKMTVYAAMIDRMDQGIGRVIQELKATNEWDNTLIFFLSDNGGCAENVAGRKLNNPAVAIGDKGSYVAYDEPWANASNTPFRKYKQWTFQGGIATPFIAHWPRGIKNKGAIRPEVGHITDLMKTCLDVAGATYPTEYKGNSLLPLRGESLLPVFKSESAGKERTLYWEHFGSEAIRKGDWKLVTGKANSNWELYNLAQDPVEEHDLSSRYPEKVQELKQMYSTWAAEVGVKPTSGSRE